MVYSILKRIFVRCSIPIWGLVYLCENLIINVPKESYNVLYMLISSRIREKPEEFTVQKTIAKHTNMRIEFSATSSSLLV